MRVDQLHDMDDFHLKAYESSTLYKKRMKWWHDAKIPKSEFKVDGDVLLFNLRYKLFPGQNMVVGSLQSGELFS